MDSAVGKPLAPTGLDPDALQQAAHSLAASTSCDGHSINPISTPAEHADDSAVGVIGAPPEDHGLSPEHLAQAAQQLVAAPNVGASESANGQANGHGIDADQVPLSTGADPGLIYADGNSGVAPEADVNLPPVQEPRQDDLTDQLSHLG